MNRLLLGYSPDFDVFDDAAPTPHTNRARARLDREAVGFDADNAEQAAELLDVAGQPGLNGLLLRLVRGASGATIRPAVEVELVRLLERAAKQVLPTMGAASRGAPARASRFFAIELEGLSAEDQEFETARRFVQFTEEAARHAAQAGVGRPPPAAAQWAAMRAAKRNAPGWPGPDRLEPLIRTDHRRGLAPLPIQGAQHA